MSYHLYGNPLTEITTPDYDKEKLKEYCGDLAGEKEDNPFSESDYSTQTQSTEDSDSSLKKNSLKKSTTTSTQSTEKGNNELSFSYDTEEVGNYELVNIKGGKNEYKHYELVKPLVVKHYSLPKKDIITNISTSFHNPVNLTLDLPAYERELVNRSCYMRKENESVKTSITYKENRQVVNFFISPLEMINCSKGKFRLYKNFSYDIDYDSYSPVNFEEVEHPDKTAIKSEFDINLTLGYSKDSENGKIVLERENNVLFEEEMNSTLSSLTIPVTSPKQGGVYDYKVKYVNDNKSLAENKFKIESTAISYQVHKPTSVDGDATVKLNLINHKNESINIEVKSGLLLNGTRKQETSKNYNLNPGNNYFSYKYTSLKKSVEKYPLQFYLAYNDEKQIINDVIITNHKPLITHVSDIETREGDKIYIDPQATDPDGDNVDYSISDPVGDDGKWKLDYQDRGNYTLAVEASDDYSKSISTINLKVKKRLEGDVNVDCEVGIHDLVTVGLAYGSQPGDNKWEKKIDLNNDEEISIIDLATVGQNYNRRC